MVLSYLWLFFFIIAFIFGIIQLLFLGNAEIFSKMMENTFDSAKTGFDISLGLTGILCLWMGLMKIGEKSGMIQSAAKLLSPFFSKIFPEIPKNHPALGAMMMNIAANILGLDNAATPLGLKAMDELQKINTQKDTASNAQILFLVLNTSGLTIIPTAIIMYRLQMNAQNPTDIFIPTLIATFFSTLVGFLAVSFFQKINLLNKYILLYLGILSAFVSLIIYYFVNLPQNEMTRISTISSNFIIFSVIILFLIYGYLKKVNVYESFIEGAKEGFEVAIKIIPYLVAMLVAVGVFRTSGAMDLLIKGIKMLVENLGLNTDFVAGLPTALMRPLSGSGARGLMVDAMKTYGVDSFVGKLVCVLQGSTDTTFYILAVYFGSVGIKKTRYALLCGLIADFTGIITAILVSYLFFA